MKNEAFFEYLPTGWTEETFRNATDEDLSKLSKEEYNRLQIRKLAEHGEQIREQEERLAMERGDYDNCGPEALHRLLEDRGYGGLGFVLARTYYGDEALWRTFDDSLEGLLMERIEKVGETPALGQLVPNFSLEIWTYKRLADASPEKVAAKFRSVIDYDDTRVDQTGNTRPQIPYGLRNMFLLVDEECMRSVTERTSRSIPFVKAVDGKLGERPWETRPPIKVAISSLLVDFSLLLAKSTGVPDFGLGGKVWVGPPWEKKLVSKSSESSRRSSWCSSNSSRSRWSTETNLSEK